MAQVFGLSDEVVKVKFGLLENGLEGFGFEDFLAMNGNGYISLDSGSGINVVASLDFFNQTRVAPGSSTSPCR